MKLTATLLAISIAAVAGSLVFAATRAPKVEPVPVFVDTRGGCTR